MINIMTNPFDELFDTNGALDYLSDAGRPIAKITLHTRTNLGRLLNPRLKVYFRWELDAYIEGKPYKPDPYYEQSVLDPLFNSEEAAEYLDLNPTYLKKVAKDGKIRSQKLGGMLFFIKEWLDEYQDHTQVGRPPKDES